MDELLRTANLFRFPHIAHEVLPKQYSEEELRFQQEFFALPFRLVAIEDLTSCILLWDGGPNEVGLERRRWFVELAPLSATAGDTWNTRNEEMKARAALEPAQRARLESAYAFAFGSITVGESLFDDERKTWRFQLNCDLMGYHMLNDDGPMPEGEQILTHYGEELVAMHGRNAMTGIEELMMFNRPDRFIVRETPARVRAADGPKIPRTHERANYTLLHPHEARAKLGLPQPSGGRGPRFVGERRRHVRRYPEDPDRWPNAHGKTIVVPATWVGPSEAKVGRRHFRIMLDL